MVRRSAWTFKDYADHFCELREKSGDYAASTNDATRGRLRQISRHIGGLKMQEIIPTVMETVYLDMRNGKAAHGRPLKGTTLNGIHEAASLMFDHAKKACVITVNPCDIVGTSSRDTGEKKHLTGAAVQEARPGRKHGVRDSPLRHAGAAPRRGCWPILGGRELRGPHRHRAPFVRQVREPQGAKDRVRRAHTAHVGMH